MHNCGTCAHWAKLKPIGLRNLEVPVGECHGGPPAADFKWPRSRATDTCAAHSALGPVAFATRQLHVEAKPLSHAEVETAIKRALPQQAEIFGTGSREAGPGTSDSAPPSTAKAARPVSRLPKQKHPHE